MCQQFGCQTTMLGGGALQPEDELLGATVGGHGCLGLPSHCLLPSLQEESNFPPQHTCAALILSYHKSQNNQADQAGLKLQKLSAKESFSI